MRQFIKRIVKTILVGYVIKFIRNKLSGKSSHPTDNKHNQNHPCERVVCSAAISLPYWPALKGH